MKEKKLSGGGNIFELRRWMYTHTDNNGRVTKEYLEGLETFMHQADSTPVAQKSGKMLCPCRTTIQNWQLVKMYGNIL